MGRKCSHCGSEGHNTRTCTTLNIRGSGLRLFGVQLQLGVSSSSSSSCLMKKSFSMDCLSASSFMSSSTPSSSSTTSSQLSIGENLDKLIVCNGYLSDDLMEGPQERKKGMPWTEEEHRMFLLGLEKLGKGDWRGISRSFVTSRTPTQVASHAQKYFLRQNSLNNNGDNHHHHHHHKRRRASLFDMVERDVSGEKIVNHSPSATMNEPFKLSSSITGFNLSEQYSGSNQLSGVTCSSQPKSQYNSDSSFKRANVQNLPLNLELTLAVKQPLDQSNPTSCLVEPIHVV